MTSSLSHADWAACNHAVLHVRFCTRLYDTVSCCCAPGTHHHCITAHCIWTLDPHFATPSASTLPRAICKTVGTRVALTHL